MAVYTTQSGLTFETDNLAYQRFQAIIGEHFQVVAFMGDDGYPHVICLVDAGSGHAFSIKLNESTEGGEPAPQEVVAVN